MNSHRNSASIKNVWVLNKLVPKKGGHLYSSVEILDYTSNVDAKSKDVGFSRLNSFSYDVINSNIIVNNNASASISELNYDELILESPSAYAHFLNSSHLRCEDNTLDIEHILTQNKWIMLNRGEKYILDFSEKKSYTNHKISDHILHKLSANNKELSWAIDRYKDLLTLYVINKNEIRVFFITNITNFNIKAYERKLSGLEKIEFVKA